MQKIITELNIVLLSSQKIEPDQLRTGIKTILSEGFDEPPKYIEIPEVAIFDYSNNSDFPVQLNIQNDRIIYVVHAIPGSTLEGNIELQTKFVKSFVDIVSSSTARLVIGNPKAIGFNISYKTTADAEEEPFAKINNKFIDVMGDKDIVANGFTIVRRKENSRYQVAVIPTIPEMGSSFTGSYTINLNKHFEPVEGWPTSIEASFRSFLSEGDTILTEINTKQDE